jgi:hypothetical protein
VKPKTEPAPEDALAAWEREQVLHRAHAEVGRLELELDKARQARDEALGAIRRAGKDWEQRR